MNVERAIIAATGLVAAGGAPGIGLALLLNGIGFPFAAEIILPLAGLAIARGTLSWSAVLAWAIVGQIVGFTCAYFLTRRAGIGLIERYGRFVFLGHERIVGIQRRFQRHGSALLFTGTCLPWAHGYMGFSAGLAGLPLATFLVLISAGTVLYTVALVAAGYVFGEALPRLIASSSGLVLALTGVAALALAAFWYSKHRFGAHPPQASSTRPDRKRR